MITRLQIVVTESLAGELAVAYLGRDRAEATAKREECEQDANCRQVVQYRGRSVTRTRKPAAALEAAENAAREAEERLQREAEERAAAAEAEAKEAAERAREAKEAAKQVKSDAKKAKAGAAAPAE